jgi:hypothetical protein
MQTLELFSGSRIEKVIARPFGDLPVTLTILAVGLFFAPLKIPSRTHLS